MCKIIIVDDEKLLRQGFIHMTDWSEYGFRIIGEASNGSEALRLIEENHPDIVVTDIRMPVMDGIELTRIIKARFPAIQVIILSSYNDFDYVRETLTLGALDYLLKPKMEYKELLNLLEKARQKIAASEGRSGQETVPSEVRFEHLRHIFLKNLVSNGHLDPATIQENLKRHALDFDESNLLLFYLLFDRNIDTMEYCGIETDLKTAFGSALAACPFLYDEQSYVLILQSVSNSPDHFGRKIIAQLQQSYGLNLWVIAGEPFAGFQNIHPNFQRLLELSRFCFYEEYNKVLESADLPNCVSSVEFDQKKLNPAIEKLDFNALYAQVAAIPEGALAAGKYIDPYTLKKFFSEVCYYLIHKLNELKLDSEEVNKKKFTYFKNLETTHHYHGLLQIFRTILLEIEALATARKESCSPLIRRIIDYIKQNYAADISLNSVAERFHMNKSYLCQLFKQQTGENFNDYLVAIRIEKAKELLREPGHNVYTVGNRVGYFNPSYFGQVFKNAVGMTPSEYGKLFGRKD
jgi:two-component system response regulator YesN